MIIRQQIITRDGVPLFLTIYTPAAPSLQTLIISSELGVEQSCYAAYSAYLQQRHVRVITFDYRGTGPTYEYPHRLSPLRWATHDLDAVVRFAHQHFPKTELLFLGHGLTAQLLGLAPASQLFDHLIFVNAQLTHRSPAVIYNLLQMCRRQVRISLKKDSLKYRIRLRVFWAWHRWALRSNGLFDLYPDTICRKINMPLLSIQIDHPALPTIAPEKLLHFFPAATICRRRLQLPVEFPLPRAHLLFADRRFLNPVWKYLWDHPMAAKPDTPSDPDQEENAPI